MVGDTLQDVDPEEFPPAAGEHCPRCDATLHDIEPHPDGRACPECEFRADLCGFDDMDFVSRVLSAIITRCWPETRTLAVLLFAVVAGIVAWGEFEVVGVGLGVAGLLLWWYSPSTYCLDCGYSAAPSEGFCANCGTAVDDVDAIVDDPTADDLLTRAWCWTDERTPDGVTIDIPNVEIETQRLGWVDRLVVGPREHWRRVFDGGIIVMALAQITVVVGACWFIWTAVTTPNGTEASSSSALATPTWAWVAPAAAIVAALVATVVVHELGHSLAAAVDGYETEKAGLLLTFGVPVAGWMRNEDDGNEEPRQRLRIVSAGILFNLVTGVAGLLVVLSLGATSAAWDAPVLLFLQMFTGMSLASVPSNAIPALGADGEHFLEAGLRLIREWRSPDLPSMDEVARGHRLAEGYDG